MTAQFGEALRHEGETHSMFSEPLGDYFALSGVRSPFDTTVCTALWRGYVGSWEIVEARLYLVELHGTLEDGSIGTLASLFPDYPERVFAHWYTGTIRIPQGERLEYVHMGYRSTYERDLLLDLEHGVVVKKRIRQNGTAGDHVTSRGLASTSTRIFTRKQSRRGGGN